MQIKGGPLFWANLVIMLELLVMKKDFDGWNEQKKNIDDIRKTVKDML